MFDGLTEMTRLMTEEGIKVEATVEDSVYLKLGATIVAAVVIAAIGFYMVKTLFG